MVAKTKEGVFIGLPVIYNVRYEEVKLAEKYLAQRDRSPTDKESTTFVFLELIYSHVR